MKKALEVHCCYRVLKVVRTISGKAVSLLDSLIFCKGMETM